MRRPWSSNGSRVDDDRSGEPAVASALVADRGLHAKPERSTAAFRWSERLSPLATGVIALFGLAMGIVALAFVCLVPWALILSLGLFFAGPELSIDRSPTWVVLAALPPLAGMLLVVAWLVQHVRAERSISFGSSDDLGAQPRSWIGTRETIVVLVIGCLGFLAFARLVFEYARIQGAIDEGLYLYAARLAMSGQFPYRDFYFDQAPLLPYALGVALGPFGYDEVAARLFAVGCTLAAMIASFIAAARLGGRLAGLVAFGLLVTSVDFISELSGGVQSNGGLTALVVALVSVALAYNRLRSALLLACVAAGLRQSFIPLPLVVACYVAFARGRPWLGMLYGILPLALVYGLALTLGGAVAPLALLRPLREPNVVRMTGATDLAHELLTFPDLLVRVMTTNFPFVLCAGPVAYLALRRGHARAQTLTALAASCAMLLIADLLPSENNARYPVTLLPLAAVLGGASVVALLGRAQAEARASLVAGLVLLLTIAPAIAYRDADFVAQFHDHPPLARFLAAADFVRSHAPPGATLVTLETPFASQTGLHLPRGLEAGSWGVYKNISTERAQQLGVVTYPMLADMVEQGVGDVVIESDRYGFVNNYANNDEQKGRLESALRARYQLTETFGNVSDWGNVRLWIRRR